MNPMMHSPSPNDGQQLQQLIQQSLQAIALQMGQSIDEQVVQQIYETAVELLSHIPYAPIRLVGK